MSASKINFTLERIEELRLSAHKKAKKVFPRAWVRVFLAFFILVSGIILLVHTFGDPDKVSDEPVWPMLVGAALGSSFVGLFIGGIYTLLRRGKMMSDFWTEAKVALVKELKDDFKYRLTYDPKGMEAAHFKRAALFRGNAFDSNDLFTIQLGKKELKIAECHAQITHQGTADDDSNTFYGLFLTLPVDMKGIKGPVKIVPTNAVKKFLSLFGEPASSKLSNAALEKIAHPAIDDWGKYVVYGPEGTNLEVLLTKDVIDRFKALHTIFDRGILNVNFSFNEGFLHVSSLTLKDLFKANLMLKTPLKNSSVVTDFQKDLKYVEEIAVVLDGL